MPDGAKTAHTWAAVAVLVLAGCAAVYAVLLGPAGPSAEPEPVVQGSEFNAPKPAGPNGYRFRAVSRGTLATTKSGQPVARFTTGARTAVIFGPSRTFSESGLGDVRITSRAWVRVLDRPWKPSAKAQRAVTKWLDKSLDWKEPDVLGVAFQYVGHAKDIRNPAGLRLAGNANFGEELQGTRDRGGDFNDYLGVDWTFPDGRSKQAYPDRYGDVDCSGYLRLVWGYRMGIPLAWQPSVVPGALPRSADWIGKHGPGVMLFKTRPTPAQISRLRPGDLVFFDTDDNGRYNHSGILVGKDSRGDLRFISSRGTSNGPTIADTGGKSIVTGDGHYASALIAARRL